MKRKYSLAFALLSIAATTLAGCFGGGDKSGDEGGGGGSISFWSSFGSGYTNTLGGISAKAVELTGVSIEHESHNSYPTILEDIISTFTDRAYPNIAMGYPDHFAKYLSKGILVPLNDYLTEEAEKDYYDAYMNENHFYDDGRSNAKDRIYALPFNKSTELLGYNGVFVDYCASVQSEFGYSGLENIPATWDEWAVQGPKYNTIFKGLIMQATGSGSERKLTDGKKVYGIQDEYGTASEFEVLDANKPAPSGKKLLLDLSKVDPDEALLMSWDATDNAFITLTRQWDAEYTSVPESEKTKKAKDRQGHVWFNSSTNQPKVIDMLKFFNGLRSQRIFGTPSDLGQNVKFSSDGYEAGSVMFMICSSGGLSYNTAKWNHRFRVAPIPYKYANKKRVISQGANICMFNQGNYESAYKVIRALTSGELQTEWCLETGYYPCSESAYKSQAYQDFLTEAERLPAKEAYASPTRVAYREGSQINSEHYMKKNEANPSLEWLKFVDPAFDGSSDLRNAVKGILGKIFENVAYGSDDTVYADHLNVLMDKDTNPKLNNSNFVWEKN